ncbi:hypothetical protein CDAR_271311 [Caerostris darwini]|uniref:Uncharacterized protein n=1 Tax=Caerostris darwini TaxID=1538125 RepID=A0AAV4TFJ9_9ARAC|nr:hypothetical protein CDAR_271311 [Caerostris darwini]
MDSRRGQSRVFAFLVILDFCQHEPKSHLSPLFFKDNFDLRPTSVPTTNESVLGIVQSSLSLPPTFGPLIKVDLYNGGNSCQAFGSSTTDGTVALGYFYAAGN